MIYKVSNVLMAQHASDGALPVVLAAAGNEARNGGYCAPNKRGDSRGPAGESRISKVARDEETAARLWSLSEELLNIKWDIT